jgi:hypothetical protein
MVTFGAAELAVFADGLGTGKGGLGTGLGTGILSAGLLRCREQSRDVVPSGCPSLDALLPAGGVRRGSLIEWLAEPADARAGTHHGAWADADEPVAASVDRSHGTNHVADPAAAHATGAGAVTLACAIARGLASVGKSSSGAVLPRTIVVVDRTGWFHPPAVLPWLAGSVPTAQLVVARPSRDDDEIWSIDQALRCPGVAAVVAWPRAIVPCTSRAGSARDARASRCRSSSGRQWMTAMRRWQLAARASGAVGLIVRQGIMRGESSWAEARLAVSSLPGGRMLERRVRVRIVGGTWTAAVTGGTAEIVLDLARGQEEPTRGRADAIHAASRHAAPPRREVARAMA